MTFSRAIESDRYCAVCGDRLGFYERIVVLTGEGVLWRTSLERDPRLSPADVVMHPECCYIAPDEEDGA